jgi:hypothetical protein
MIAAQSLFTKHHGMTALNVFPGSISRTGFMYDALYMEHTAEMKSSSYISAKTDQWQFNLHRGTGGGAIPYSTKDGIMNFIFMFADRIGCTKSEVITKMTADGNVNISIDIGNVEEKRTDGKEYLFTYKKMCNTRCYVFSEQDMRGYGWISIYDANAESDSELDEDGKAILPLVNGVITIELPDPRQQTEYNPYYDNIVSIPAHPIPDAIKQIPADDTAYTHQCSHCHQKLCGTS